MGGVEGCLAGWAQQLAKQEGRLRKRLRAHCGGTPLPPSLPDTGAPVAA